MRALIATSVGLRPKTATRPRVANSNPRIIFSVVVLPDPFGPSSPNTSRRPMSRSKSQTAVTFSRSQKSRKIFVSFTVRTTASLFPISNFQFPI